LVLAFAFAFTGPAFAQDAAAATDKASCDKAGGHHRAAGDEPFRDYANDTELKIAIGKKLVNLVVEGVTEPLRLRNLTVESLLLPRH
jgi:hypothetical protein